MGFINQLITGGHHLVPIYQSTSNMLVTVDSSPRQITMLLESMPEFSTTPDACRSPWERRPGLSEWWANRYPPKSTMAGKSTKCRFSWENHRTKFMGIFQCHVWLPEGSRLCMSMKHEEWWDSTNGDVTCWKLEVVPRTQTMDSVRLGRRRFIM